MKELIAVRNLRLCTKDCLCLYVCPTGASDTEDSVIDTARCIGCGSCAAACPSGAISMVPVRYPPQQKKAETVLAPSYVLANAKARQEQAARQLAAAAETDGLYRLLTAVAKSVRLVNEDLLREAATRFDRILTVEDGILRGGVGEAVTKFFADNGLTPRVRSLGIHDSFIEQGTVAQLQALCGYDTDGIERAIKEML